MRASERATGDRFVIDGWTPISGTITPAGNKNEALPVLAASLMVRGPVTIDNVPRIRDVETLVRLLRELGAAVDLTGEHTVTVDAPVVPDHRPPGALAAEIRGSFLDRLIAMGAALCAEGRSVIHNVRQVDRSDERIDERRRALGARIARER